MATRKSREGIARRKFDMADSGGIRSSGISEILRAATREFDELGCAEASIASIAERAGTSKSLITYYFPTKEALAATVISLSYERGAFMACDRRADEPLDAILDAVEGLAEAVLNSPLARASLSLRRAVEFKHRLPPSKYHGWLARFGDYLDEAKRLRLVRPSIDTYAESRILLGTIVGVIEIGLATGCRATLVSDVTEAARYRIELIRSDSPES